MFENILAVAIQVNFRFKVKVIMSNIVAFRADLGDRRVSSSVPIPFIDTCNVS